MFEETFATDLTKRGIKFEYELERIHFSKPTTYTPDFVLTSDDGSTIYIETKGRFTSFDRAKHLLIKAQHPGLDIRFIFMRSAQAIRKGSKTTYAAWCVKHGFKFSDKKLPKEWANE